MPASAADATAQADPDAQVESAKTRAKTARRARAARQRAEAAKGLALPKARSAGQPVPDLESQSDPQTMPSRNLPTNAAGEVTGNAQRNFTGPESHIPKGGDGWIQGYNCQVAVDSDHQVIVAVGISNQASDTPHLLPMLERILANTGRPEKLLADAGYCSNETIKGCEQRRLDAYISTSRLQHGKRSRPSRGPSPRDLDARGRMDRKIRSKAGQALYALLKIIAEPVFGQIKDAPRAGPLPSEGNAKGVRGVEPDGHHPQPPQVAQGGPEHRLMRRKEEAQEANSQPGPDKTPQTGITRNLDLGSGGNGACACRFERQAPSSWV